MLMPDARGIVRVKTDRKNSIKNPDNIYLEVDGKKYDLLGEANVDGEPEMIYLLLKERL